MGSIRADLTRKKCRLRFWFEAASFQLPSSYLRGLQEKVYLTVGALITVSLAFCTHNTSGFMASRRDTKATLSI